jgi:hypothetical protein
LKNLPSRHGFSHFTNQSIAARILNVRTARRQNAENHHREKLPALHRSISRAGRKNDKQLFAPRDKVTPLNYETA